MSNNTEIESVQKRSLSMKEMTALMEAEADIESGLSLVWLGLRTIHDQRLYRDQYDTFEAYCQGRWDRTRRWGYQQVEAGRVYQVIEDNLCTNGTHCVLPTSERQVRPLVGLDDNQIVQAWQHAMHKAKGNVPSGALIEKVVREEFAPSVPSFVAPSTREETEETTEMFMPDISLFPEDVEVEEAVGEPYDLPNEEALFRQMASTCENMAQPLGTLRAEQVREVVLAALIALLPQPLPTPQVLCLPPPPRLLLLPAPPPQAEDARRMLLLPLPPLEVEDGGWIKRLIRVRDGSIQIKQEEVNSEITQAIKQVPGREYDSSSQTWCAPLSSAAHALALAQHCGFFLSRKDEDALLEAAELSREQSEEARRKRQATAAEKEARRIERERQKQARLKARYDASFATDADIEVSGLGGELYAFQRAAVKYLLEAKHAFLADEMGLGKTPEALATLQAANAFPALIICPASVRPNWRKETERWLPGRTICYLKDGRSKLMEADITIINYDLLGKHLDALLERQWQALVVDESHYIKNYKAQRTEFVQRLAANVPYRFLLSGTAITSKPIELAPQLRVLGTLDTVFGGFHAFTERYTDGRYAYYEGGCNLKELNAKLRQHCYVRRLKRDVLKSLPPKRRLTQWVELDTSREYKAAERDLIGYVRTQAQNNLDFLASVAHLSKEERQEAKRARATDAQERAERGQVLVQISKLRQIAARGKIAAAKEWIEEYLNQIGAKLVVFGWHEDVIHEIAEAFHAPRISGDIGAEARQKAVERFQNDPACRVIVCNIRSGGQGITLTAAAATCFIEMDWTPATLRQAEDRIHRIGQEAEVVENYYLLADVSIDKYMGRLIGEKAGIVDATLDGVREQGADTPEETASHGFIDWLMGKEEIVDQQRQ